MSIFNKSALLNDLKSAAKSACLPVAWVAAAAVPFVVVGFAFHMPVEDSNHPVLKRMLLNWPKRWNSKNLQDETKLERPARSVAQAKTKYLQPAID